MRISIGVRKPLALGLVVFLWGTMAFAQFAPKTWKIVQKSKDGTPTIILPATPLRMNGVGNRMQQVVPPEERVHNFVSNFAHTELGIPAENVLITQGSIAILNTIDHIFSAEYNGIPIQDRSIKLTVGSDDNTIIAIGNTIPPYKPNAEIALVTVEEIGTKMGVLLGDNLLIQRHPNLVYRVSNNALLLAYEIYVRDEEGGSWRLTYDATTGELLERRSRIHFHKEHITASTSSTISGSIHPRNPFDKPITVGFPFLKLQAGATVLVSDSLGNFQISDPLPLNIIGTLDGIYCSVTRQDGPNSSLQLLFTGSAEGPVYSDNNSLASERDAYYSVNKARSFIRAFDTSLVELDKHIKINVNIDAKCNAFYDPDSVTLNFYSAGGQCTNTAEVADIAYHEFGHRIQDAIYSKVTGRDILNGALAEGFADIYSAFMRDDSRIGVGFYALDTSRLLRNCDNTNRRPDDITQDIHISGQIIAGAFWDLRKFVGLPTALRLFHYTLYHTPDDFDDRSDFGLKEAFGQTLLATLISDDDNNNLLDGTPHSAEILKAFKLHNISLSEYFPITVDQIPDFDTAAVSYPVTIHANYIGAVGEIDTNEVLLHYSTNGWKTSLSSLATKTGDVYQAVIPQQPLGTIINYYASGRITVAGDSEVSAISSFLVGFKNIISDHCDSLGQWKTGLPTDAALSGLWELCEPYSTYDLHPTNQVQLDTDHSPVGSLCFVTGNKNSISQSHNLGQDDVDGGATTLTSPMLFFDKPINPIIRYWYYYSNDQGANPAKENWEVRISGDNGLSWKTVTKTNISAKIWSQAYFEVNDFFPGATSAQLQFIASDYTSSLVEAGIDDLETFDAIAEKPNITVALEETNDISIYPNPARIGGELYIVGTSIQSTLKLFDMTGRKVATAFGSNLQVPSNCAEGIYLLRLFSGQVAKNFKIMLLK